MRYVKFLFAAPLVWLLGYGAFYFFADSFHPAHVHTPLKNSSNLSPALPSDLFKNSYYYLGKGSQCYCFESSDHNYVLKLFRCNRYRVAGWLTPKALPSFLQKIYAEKRALKQAKWERFIESCHLAEQLKNECALVFTHLEKTKGETTVFIYDKLHRKHRINPHNLLFVIQKKAETLDRATQSLPQEKIDEVLAGVTNLLEKRYRLGIGDDDAVIGKNMGVLESQPFFLDIGTFYYDENLKNPLLYQKEMKKIIYNYSSRLPPPSS